jgi:hypothetical protein
MGGASCEDDVRCMVIARRLVFLFSGVFIQFEQFTTTNNGVVVLVIKNVAILNNNNNLY